jgi:hypothetical protein
MNNLILKDIKNIYENYFILIIIFIFVSIYFVINYRKVMNNNFSSQDFVTPVLITSIVILICNLVIFTDDNDVNNDFDSSYNNIYKNISKDVIDNDNNNFENLKEQKIYKILNDNNNTLSTTMKINNKNKNINDNKKLHSDDKYLNKNIFLPYKSNNVKFELKI